LITKTSRLTAPGSLDIVLTGLPVPGFPAPLPAAAHFSAADFFRDCPWLNVPAHRKADILVEPLYPRLGLLGGAPESGGKMSKLAALAAARKKKEGEKAAAAPEVPSTPQPERLDGLSSPKPSGTPLSLSERLAASKLSKSSETNGGLRRLGKPGVSVSLPAPQQLVPEPSKPSPPSLPEPTKQEEPDTKPEPQKTTPNIRASPSTFASVILGNAAGPTMAEPSHLNSNNVDLLQIYGQDHAEPFDFAAPSPDDVVMNAQSTAKGLAIRRKG
jgi:elongation factor 1 alpha-like protein